MHIYRGPHCIYSRLICIKTYVHVGLHFCDVRLHKSDAGNPFWKSISSSTNAHRAFSWLNEASARELREDLTTYTLRFRCPACLMLCWCLLVMLVWFGMCMCKPCVMYLVLASMSFYVCSRLNRRLWDVMYKRMRCILPNIHVVNLRFSLAPKRSLRISGNICETRYKVNTRM